MKIYLEWLVNTMLGIYSGLFGKLWFLGVGCTRSIPSQYKMKASKRLRAITAIIMHSDKTSLTEA
jgi:hypothetical protein